MSQRSRYLEWTEKDEEILLQVDRAKDVYVPILTRSVLM